MSRKTTRLKNRLRIERERAEKRMWELNGLASTLANREYGLREERKNLDRSLAMRMRLREPDPYGPRGPVFQLTVAVWPEEFRIASLRRTSVSRTPVLEDVSYTAARHGHEVGKQVEEVIRRCLLGELEEFRRAL